MRYKPKQPELIVINGLWMIRCNCGNRCWGGGKCKAGCERDLPLDLVKKRNLLNYCSGVFDDGEHDFFSI